MLNYPLCTLCFEWKCTYDILYDIEYEVEYDIECKTEIMDEFINLECYGLSI